MCKDFTNIIKNERRKTMGKNLQLYFDAIGQRASSGEYKADNKLGFIGKYQMGKYVAISQSM